MASAVFQLFLDERISERIELEHPKKCRRKRQKGKPGRDSGEELLQAAMTRAREEDDNFSLGSASGWEYEGAASRSVERSFPWFFLRFQVGKHEEREGSRPEPLEKHFSGQVRREALIEINQEPVFVFLGGSECTEWPFLNSSTLTRLSSNTAQSSFGHCVFKVPEDST